MDAFAAQRYTDRVFPAYAHRLGRTPHPVTDPAGHSHADVTARAEAVAPSAWRSSPEYLFGCDLYNHGYWWEAHESWEAIWHAIGREGPQARFLQGLIQGAACALQLERGRPDGVQRLLARSTAHLAQVKEETPYMGLDIATWSAKLNGYYSERLAHDALSFPYILLGPV